MANKKISQLASASALAGTEVLPIVQGGTTKKVTAQAIADLASGGGSAPSFGVTANGILGSDITATYVQKASVPKTVNGVYSTEVGNYASFSFNAAGSNGYGGYGGSSVSTTATNIAFHTRYIGDLNITGSTVVTTFSFPDTIAQDSPMSGLSFSGAALTTVNFPLLQTCKGISINSNSPALTTLNFSSLTDLSSYAQIQINAVTAIAEIGPSNFPLLKQAAFSIYEPGFLQVINLPSAIVWKSVYHVNSGMGSGASVLNTLRVPAIINYESAYVSYNGHSQLANVVLGTIGTLKTLGLSWGPANINFEGCALTQASVDGILTLLASLDGTNGTDPSNNGTINLTGGTNAAPSSTGLAAKAILLGRGFTISHN
jgi:hypothetical protein